MFSGTICLAQAYLAHSWGQVRNFSKCARKPDKLERKLCGKKSTHMHTKKCAYKFFVGIVHFFVGTCSGESVHRSSSVRATNFLAWSWGGLAM